MHPKKEVKLRQFPRTVTLTPFLGCSLGQLPASSEEGRGAMLKDYDAPTGEMYAGSRTPLEQ
eukprot:1159743-Pelagomonas_calceolata.AAC.8